MNLKTSPIYNERSLHMGKNKSYKKLKILKI